VNGSQNSQCEEAALKAADILMKQGCFSECWLTKRNRFYDRNGVDLILVLKSGLAVYVQVKLGGGRHIFSNENRPNHGGMDKHFRLHPNITVFLIIPKQLLKSNNPDKYKKIAEELKKAVNNAINKTKPI